MDKIITYYIYIHIFCFKPLNVLHNIWKLHAYIHGMHHINKVIYTPYPLMERTGEVSDMSTKFPITSSSTSRWRPPGEEPMWPRAHTAAFMKRMASDEHPSSCSARIAWANLETWFCVCVWVCAQVKESECTCTYNSFRLELIEYILQKKKQLKSESTSFSKDRHPSSCFTSWP